MGKTIIWTLVIAIILATALSDIAIAQEISVELHVPDYLHDADLLKHPQKFFSGRTIKILGEFPTSESINLKIKGKNTGAERELEVKESTTKYIKTDIPTDVPTDNYQVLLTINKDVYQTTLRIYGFTTEERAVIGEGSGAGVGEVDPAILYRNQLPLECDYWELALAGNIENLFVAANDPKVCVSHDRGMTWNAELVSDIFVQTLVPGSFIYIGDSASLVTSDGTYFLTGLIVMPHPAASPDRFAVVITGIFYKSPANGLNPDDFTIIKIPPADLPLEEWILMDRPRMTFDPIRRKIYITTIDGVELPIQIFISDDLGETFNERLFTISLEDFGVAGNSYSYSHPLAMDINREGKLMGAIRVSLPTEIRDLIYLMEFNEDISEFELWQGPSFFEHSGVARISSGSERGDFIYSGPEMGIIKNSESHYYGRIYLVWSEPESQIIDPNFEFNSYGVNFDIYFAYSDNDGETWSDSIKINDDNTNADQYFPSLRIDSEGVVHVVFLDKRRDPDSPFFDITYTKIVGDKVSENVIVNEFPVLNSLGGREPGDYFDMVQPVEENKVYIAYPCGSNEEMGTPTNACVTALDHSRVSLRFIRGDSNIDGRVDLSDAVFILNYLFQGGERPMCEDAADVNDDGVIDVSDAVYTLLYLFSGGAEPPEPFIEIGLDPTEDELTC